MAKSMLNPPEREQYVVGSIVKKLAKPLANLFEDSSEKAIENVMKQAHEAVEKAPTGVKRSEVFKQVAEDQDLTVQNVKDIEKVFAYRAGGGGKENILGEVKQVIRAMTTKPTSGQADAEDFGGARTTREARKKAGETFVGGVLLGGTIGAGAVATAWSLHNKGKPSSPFQKAFSKAHNAGKETFTFKGKEYSTDVRKGKAEGGEMESSATARTREAAIEKDERERRERMMKAEAKRLGISEERLKEILLEREQAEMDRKGSEAAGRFEKTPMAEGGKFPDLTGDGEVTQADVLKGRGVFAEGSEVDESESKLDEKNKYIFDKAVELAKSGKASGLDMGMRMATIEANKKFGSDRDLMSPERRGELDKNMKRHLEMIKMLEERDRKAEGSLTREELEDGTYDVQRMEGDDFKSIVMSRPLREDEGGFTDKELQEYRERMALFDKLAEPYVKAGKPIPKKINDLSLGKVPPSLSRGMDRSGKAEGSMLMPVEREQYGVGSKILKKALKFLKGKSPEEQEAEIKAYVSNVIDDTPQKTLDRLSEKEQRLITVGKTEKMFSNIGNKSRLDQAKEEIVVNSGGDLKQYEDYLDAQLRSVDDLAEKRLGEAENRASRDVFAEGSMLMPVEGMPVDTYPNIPEDEMDEALASQLPDDEMEDDYISYVMDESLDDSEQEYLAGVLQQDDRLSDILDKVITTASEFSGAGEVEGPGTGVSDSIPARLSDGEFVFTKKATDQIGADALQRMMDDAERAYDGGLQAMANGGMMEDEDPENPAMSKTKEEIEKLMMGANRMPSLR